MPYLGGGQAPPDPLTRVSRALWYTEIWKLGEVRSYRFNTVLCYFDRWKLFSSIKKRSRLSCESRMALNSWRIPIFLLPCVTSNFNSWKDVAAAVFDLSELNLIIIKLFFMAERIVSTLQIPDDDFACWGKTKEYETWMRRKDESLT